jgi:DNA-binding transcriptional LysR family regulator
LALQQRVLRVHPGVLFCHPQHPLLQRQPLKVHDLLGYPLAGTQLPDEVTSALRRMGGSEALLSIQCDNFMVLKELVSTSQVLSMAPWDVIAQDVANGRLAVLPLGFELYHQHSAYGIVSRAGHSLSPGVAELRRILREQDASGSL